MQTWYHQLCTLDVLSRAKRNRDRQTERERRRKRERNAVPVIASSGVVPVIIYEAQSAHIVEIRFPHVMHGAWPANAPLSTVNTFYGSLTLLSA